MIYKTQTRNLQPLWLPDDCRICGAVSPSILPALLLVSKDFQRQYLEEAMATVEYTIEFLQLGSLPAGWSTGFPSSARAHVRKAKLKISGVFLYRPDENLGCG